MNKKIVVLILSFCLIVLSACSVSTSNNSSQEQTAIDDKKDELENTNPINEFNDWLKESVDELFDGQIEEARNNGTPEDEIQMLEDMRNDVYTGLVRKHLTNASDEELQEAWESELSIQIVRHTKPTAYPTIKYKDAFENFFGRPKWVYFEGKRDNSDDLIRIVEFTGECTYKDDDATALIQFEITDESLAPTYFSINDRSMNELELYSLIKKVFETYELDSNKVTPAN